MIKGKYLHPKNRIEVLFTHKGAKEVVTKLEHDIDEYAVRYGTFANKIREEEVVTQPDVFAECASSGNGLSVSMKSD